MASNIVCYLPWPVYVFVEFSFVDSNGNVLFMKSGARGPLPGAPTPEKSLVLIEAEVFFVVETTMLSMSLLMYRYSISTHYDFLFAVFLSCYNMFLQSKLLTNVLTRSFKLQLIILQNTFFQKTHPDTKTKNTSRKTEDRNKFMFLRWNIMSRNCGHVHFFFLPL